MSAKMEVMELLENVCPLMAFDIRYFLILFLHFTHLLPYVLLNINRCIRVFT